MANRLSCNVIVLHFKREPKNRLEKKRYWKSLLKSLNELKPYARKYCVKIALENYEGEDSHEIKKLLSEYDPDFLGLCYDSGHGNIGDGLIILDELKDRLISIHLHDNDGKTDQHKPIFSGTIDWVKLAELLSKSSYTNCINMEVNMRNSTISDETSFLSMAHQTGLRFSEMREKAYN